MKKKLFNPKLYTEGLDQLKLTGFILTVFTMLVTAIPPIAIIIENINRSRVTIGYSKEQVELVYGVAPVVLVFMYIGSYLFSSRIFSYGNKRRASDFYDSLRNTRLCTYISFGLAALTWTFFIIIINSLEGVLLYSIAGDITFSSWEYIRFVIYELLVSLSVSGATFMAMALTGTAFSNFIVMGVILLLPRFVLTFFQVMLLENSSTLVMSTFTGLMDPANNFVTAPVISIAYGYEFDYVITHTFGYFYTLFIALVYLALAGVFFHYRKTETAEKSAPNSVLQHVIRCGLTLPFALFFGWSAYYVTSEGYWSDVIIPLLLFALAAFIYFIYEAITTKSFKKLLTSLPLFVAVLVVSVVSMFTIVEVSEALDHRIPDPEKVVSVSVSNNDYAYGYYGSYIEDAERNIRYDDPELIEDLVRDLQLTVDGYGETVTISSDSSSSDILDFVKYGNYVKFYMKNGSVVTRRFGITYDTEKNFKTVRANTPEYVNAVYALPDPQSVTVNCGSLDLRNSAEIYSIYCEEFKELPYETAVGLIENYGGIGMNVTVTYGTGRGYSYFTIDQRTPKALAKYMALANNQFRLTELAESFSAEDEWSIEYADINIYNPRSHQRCYFYYEGIEITEDTEDYVQELTEILKTASDRDPADSQYTMHTVSGYVELSNKENGEYKGVEAYETLLLMTQEEMQRVGQLFELLGLYCEGYGFITDGIETAVKAA